MQESNFGVDVHCQYFGYSRSSGMRGVGEQRPKKALKAAEGNIQRNALLGALYYMVLSLYIYEPV